MTVEPPDGEEEEGRDLGTADSISVPELAEVTGDPEAVLFVPDGMDPTEVLNVRVVGVNPLTMRLIIARRC
jgi:hypothetical protein